MLLPFRKKPAADTAPEGEGEARSYNEYIPYYGHYNPHTIITKNGELLQTIKIDSNNAGLNYESGANDEETVRAMIRNALQEYITSDNFAVSIHTLRKRRPVNYSGNYTHPFAAHLFAGWQDTHRWRHQYYNEIYVTIIHEGQRAILLDTENLKNVFSLSRNRAYRNRYLDSAYHSLEQAVSGIIASIGGQYRAKRLAVVERIPEGSAASGGVFYSEPMEFLGTLTNLRSIPMPVLNVDISNMISPHILLVGFNAIETKDADGGRRFGALLSLKQYREFPTETADRILQLPVELIISQNFNFIPADKALTQYKDQKWLFGVSGDNYSLEASGLLEMIERDHGSPVDFGEQQTSIMVVVDEYRSLDDEVRQAQNAFTEIGLITIREDIKLEECYWAMLPGNFEFIRRKEAIATPRIAGLCRLNRFPSGSGTNLHWNEPLALVPTIVNSPYFFNFHYHDNGHTVIFDFNSFRDSIGRISLNFLLTMSTKFGGPIYVFDRHQSSKLFANKMGGNYHRFVDKKQGDARHLQLNPFQIEGSKRNLSFLLAWLASLLENEIGEAEKEILRGALSRLFELPQPQRSLPQFLALVSQIDPTLAGYFSEFHSGGVYSGIFDHASDAFTPAQALSVFDMDPAANDARLTVPLFSYLLHRVIDALDGKPTIIVIHEAWALLENSFFAPRLESLLEMLRQNNAIVIATTNAPQECEGTRTLAALAASCATRLYIPDDISLDYTSPELGISENDSRTLRRMQRNMGDMLVKQAKETIGIRLNLDHAEDAKAIYSNDIKNLIAAGGKFASIPKDE